MSCRFQHIIPTQLENCYAINLTRGCQPCPATSRRKRLIPRICLTLDPLEQQNALDHKLGLHSLPCQSSTRDCTPQNRSRYSDRDFAQVLSQGAGEYHGYIRVKHQAKKLMIHANRQKRLEKVQVRHEHTKALQYAAHAAQRMSVQAVTNQAGNGPQLITQAQSASAQSVTGTAVVGASSQSTAVVAQTTLDVQLQVGVSGALSQLMPLFATADVTVQPTLISRLYEVSGTSEELDPLAAELSASPLVQYASPMQVMHVADVPNDPQYVSGNQWC